MLESCRDPVSFISREYAKIGRLDTDQQNGILNLNLDMASGKWFPRHISDLDYICNNVITYDPSGENGLNANHPSFTDKNYRKRREEIWHLCTQYKQGTPIPRIDYTPVELKTWKTIYLNLKKLYNQYGSQTFLDNFKLLEQHCGYSENRVPQLEDISQYLKGRTGFTLRPCGGYLNSRDFLYSLAFRVFNCTQYLRHPSDPYYTPEPDTCHELLGHMPMLLDPVFAQFSHEIGLASLGSSQADCDAITRLYFFTVEFGLSSEGQQFDEAKPNLKVYGAGLLSSIDELKFCMSKAAKICPFNIDRVIGTEPELSSFQKQYFYTESIDDALLKLREYIRTIERPFELKYDAQMNSVQLLAKSKSAVDSM